MDYIMGQVTLAICDHACRRATEAGDPYNEETDGVVMVMHASVKALEIFDLPNTSVHEISIQSIEDVDPVALYTLESNEIISVRIIGSRHEAHPEMELLLRRSPDVPQGLLLDGIEVHGACRGQGLVPRCLQALSGNGTRPVLVDPDHVVSERMRDIMQRHGTPHTNGLVRMT